MLVSSWMMQIGPNDGCSKVQIFSRSVLSFVNANDAAKVGVSRGSTELAVAEVDATAGGRACVKQASQLPGGVGFFPFSRQKGPWVFWSVALIGVRLTRTPGAGPRRPCYRYD